MMLIPAADIRDTLMHIQDERKTFQLSRTESEKREFYRPTVDTGDLVSSRTITVSASTNWTLGTTMRMARMSKA